MEQNSMDSFQLDEEDSAVNGQLTSMLRCFGEDFISRLSDAGGATIDSAMELFSFVMQPLNLLGSVINTVTEGWVIIKGGILALLNIFFYMGKLVAFVAGGITTLVGQSVSFPLTVILTAVDGAQAFFNLLRPLTKVFDLIMLIADILTIPAQIAHFIAGLGGEVSQGITGVFNIVAKMFDFAQGFFNAIQEFVDILLRFFGRGRPNYREVKVRAESLLTISFEQKATYRTNWDPYEKFLGSVAGTRSFSINGVGVGSIVQLLTDSVKTEKSLVKGIIKALAPLVPIGRFFPKLLAGMVKMLQTSRGATYIQRILPSVNISQESLQNIKNNLLGAALRTSYIDQPVTQLRSLPAPQILKQFPIISAIYKELDEAAQEYNITLDALLENDEETAEELVEITTKALETPVS